MDLVTKILLSALICWGLAAMAGLAYVLVAMLGLAYKHSLLVFVPFLVFFVAPFGAVLAVLTAQLIKFIRTLWGF